MNKTKKIRYAIVVLLVVVFMMSAIVGGTELVFASTNFTGAGTADNPFQISSVADWLTFSDLVDKGTTILGSSKKYSEASYVLTNNIDFSGKTINPVTKAFSGVLDGQGYVLKNLKMSLVYNDYPTNPPPIPGSEAALFLINNGTIKNVNFENASLISRIGVDAFKIAFLVGTNNGEVLNINVNNLDVHADNRGWAVTPPHVAGLVLKNYGKIEGVSIKGTGRISVGSDDDAVLGGLVLNNYGSINKCDLDFTSITISPGNVGSIVVGGVAGKTTGSITNTNVTFGNLYTYVDKRGFCVGGIAGEGSGTISRSKVHFTGTVNVGGDHGSYKYDNHFGGLVGKSSGSVARDCVVKADKLITVTNYCDVVAGGLFGSFGSAVNCIVDLSDFTVRSNDEMYVYFGGISGNGGTGKNVLIKLGTTRIYTYDDLYYQRYSATIGGSGGNLKNVYVYNPNLSLSFFYKSSAGIFNSGTITNVTGNTKIASIVGNSTTTGTEEVSMKVGDSVVDLLSAWVKKNGTFEKQYARWKNVDEEGNVVFPFMSYENPDVQINVNGTIYDGATDATKPTEVVLTKNTEVFWTVYQFSTMTANDVTASYEEGGNLFTSPALQKRTYNITFTNDHGASVYFRIVIDKEFPVHNLNRFKQNKDFVRSKVYEVQGKYFATLQNAINVYGQEIFKTRVRLANLENIALFAEKLGPGEVVSTGEYYRYKDTSSDDYECYFSRENLAARIAKDIEKEIQIKYLPTSSSMTGEITSSELYDGEIKVNGQTAFLVKDFIFESVDCAAISVSVYGANDYKALEFGKRLLTQLNNPKGLYTIKETSAAGNTSYYNIYFDKEISELKMKINTYQGDIITQFFDLKNLANGSYYYNGITIISIADIDKHFLVGVKKLGGVEKFYNFSELPEITEKGKYTIALYDRSGNKANFTASIGTENPDVVFTEATREMKLKIEKTNFAFKRISIVRNGQELAMDDKGATISGGRLDYTFAQGGYYTVYIHDYFNRLLSFEYLYAADLPQFEILTGIKDNKAHDDVTIKYDKSKYTLEMTKENKEYIFEEVVSGNIATIVIPHKVTRNGNYSLKLKHINEVRFYSDTTFVMNKTSEDTFFVANEIDYVGSADGTKPAEILLKNTTKIRWSVEPATSMSVLKDGEEIKVDYAEGEHGFYGAPESVYDVTITTDRGSLYFRIYVDQKAPEMNESALAQNKAFLKAKYFEVSGKYYGSKEIARSAFLMDTLSNRVSEKMLSDKEIFAEKLAPGEEITEGIYYVYEGLCYFSNTNLEKKISADFDNQIKVGYIKSGASVSDGKLTDSLFDSIVTIDGQNAYLVKDYTFKNSDSESIELRKLGDLEFVSVEYGKSLRAQMQNLNGLYEIRERDKVGNETTYMIFMGEGANSLNAQVKMYGSEAVLKNISLKEIANGSYYYETFSLEGLVGVDRQSIISIKKDNGAEKLYSSSDDVLPSLMEKGAYVITVTSRLGDSFKFTINIGTETPSVSFSIRANSLNIVIGQVNLKEYKELTIYRNSELLVEDKNAVEITPGVLEYTFAEGGFYAVTIVDGFGRQLTYEYLFEKDMPKLAAFEGVKNAEAYKDVVIKFDHTKYNLEILKDDVITTLEGVVEDKLTVVKMPFVSTNNGAYTLYVKDKHDEKFFATIKFQMAVSTDVPILVGVNEGGQTAGEVMVTWAGSGYYNATYTKDGIYLGIYEKDKKLSENGYYAVTVKGEKGEEFNFTFRVKESLDYRILVGGKYVNMLKITNQSVQFETAFPKDNVIVISEGGTNNKIPYEWGEVLAAEGVYDVKVISFAASSDFTFEIDKTAPMGRLSGVSEGGVTNGEVKLTWAEEGLSAKLMKDGKLEGNYTKDKAIDKDGKFEIQLADNAGNVAKFIFTIKRTVEIKMNVINGGVSNGPVRLSSTEKNLELEIKKDGESFVQKISSPFEESGHYEFVVYDSFKNATRFDFYVVTTPLKEFRYSLPENYQFLESYKDGSIVTKRDYLELGEGDDGNYEYRYQNISSGQIQSFTVEIDTVPPEVELIGVSNGGSTKEVVKALSQEQNLNVELVRNGSTTKYSLGAEIAQDGEYELRIKDAAGNETILYFFREYAMNTAGKVAVGGTGATVLATLFELLRKRKIKLR